MSVPPLLLALLAADEPDDAASLVPAVVADPLADPELLHADSRPTTPLRATTASPTARRFLKAICIATPLMSAGLHPRGRLTGSRR
jgi:hypothetical protein